MNRNFFAELQRRNVYRAAIAYAVVGWLLIQIATSTFPVLEIPNWATKLVLALVLLGFPIALILAWAFELTPEGIKRTDDVAPHESITRRTGRKLVSIIAILGVLALGLFLFQIVGTDRRAKSNTASPLASGKSVAVLPFADLSATRDQEYFGDGLAEELLNVLVQIDGLSVASRTSSFAFKGKNLSVPAIAQALGVGHIVEGSVRRVDNRLRVTAQLIDVATDRHLWSQSFDRDATDIFVIQADIARSIAEALKVRLGKAGAGNPGTENVEAYELYLLGLYHWNQRTEEGLRKALEIFRRATERDPSFARAFAGISMTYVLLPGYAAFDRDLADREAAVAARKAVELDPKSPEALTALAQTFNLTQAVETFDRALALNPRYVTARHWKGISLTTMGRLTEGEAELRTARSLDPASLPLQSFLGLNLARQGRFEDALTETLDLLRRAPDYRNGLHQGFMYGVVLGRGREFVGLLERYFRVIGEDPVLGGTIVDAIEKPEQRPAAIAALEPVAARHRVGGKKDQMANLFALLKAETQTLDFLEDRELDRYAHWPIYDFLRGNPRYEALLMEAKRRAEGAQTAPEGTARP